MKNVSLTQVVRNENRMKLINKLDYIPALIANIFSVIFSTSIIFELKGIVNGFVLVLLSIFVILFLIQNEVFKVKEIRKVFKGNKNALLPFCITFLISVFLATTGMYFYTNKSNQIKDISTLDKTEQLNEVTKKYQIQSDNINNKVFEVTQECEAINIELKYWKRASAASLEERQDIRNKVDKLQNDLTKQRDLFNANKTLQLNKINKLMETELNIVETKYNNKMNRTKTNDFIT